jgi:hypothetical protein
MDKRERSNSFTGNQETLLSLLNSSSSSYRPNHSLASLINNSSTSNGVITNSISSSTNTITRNNSNPTNTSTSNNNNTSNDSDIFFIDTNSLDNYGISLTNESAMPSSLTSSEIIPRNILAPVYQVKIIIRNVHSIRVF